MEKLVTFPGKLVSRVVSTVRTELIFTVGFRVQAETSHFCEEIQHFFPFLREEAERSLVFMSQGSLG